MVNLCHPLRGFTQSYVLFPRVPLVPRSTPGYDMPPLRGYLGIILLLLQPHSQQNLWVKTRALLGNACLYALRRRPTHALGTHKVYLWHQKSRELASTFQ